MLPPRKVKFQAEKKENENIAFRSFLKANADEKELDAQFLRLHQEVFSEYDCTKCRNCCKAYHGVIPEADIEQDAKHLNVSSEQFMELFLKPQITDSGYETMHKPCDFFDAETKECRLGECKPENCKKYPYTDQQERIHSLYGVLEAVAICPVVHEIFERLKKEYGFVYRGRN